MSTYVLMRILESAPHRYELGIRLLTFGGVDRAYDRLTSRIESGQRVLDLGCGTGALTLRAARRGAQVKGIDINPEMLEVARVQAQKAGLAERVELVEKGVAELDGEKPQSYDAVVTGLCLSELSEDEIRYTLEQVRRILRPGGLLLIADEVKPGSRARRLLYALIRAPLVALTYVITQQTTHAIADLTERLREAGLVIESTHASGLGSFLEIVARAPTGTGR
jgi:demethylmenaquinone methyltransferase/2-methoxy-6-polyprenyl-1,4-benzoquinol methylase